MIKLATIVGHVGGQSKGESEEQKGWTDSPATSAQIKGEINKRVAGVFDLVERKNDKRSFDEVERALRGFVFAIGRLFLAYFLARREESSEPEVNRWLRKGYGCSSGSDGHAATPTSSTGIL